eukprot:TRINITY_DN1196_c0_g1_i2.p1 TRINITY_DN1196_c0_g1~~TRINITY_DN1196_c0_g1_i2.p1  ORF type:complete len:289 (-),score=50.22 TRINITY_DN1196_c0_g1_i2:315-1181(-)
MNSKLKAKTDMTFKESNPEFKTRIAEATKVRTKHPGKIPIICERSAQASPGCPSCQKEKFLAQSTLTIAKFGAAVKKQLKAAQGVDLLVHIFHNDEEVVPDPSQLIGQMDEKYRDPDGYLYVRYRDVLAVEPSAPEALEPEPVKPPEVPAASTEDQKCLLAVTGEEWVWAMTDPRWEFNMEIQGVTETKDVLASCTKRYSEFQELENMMCAELGEASWGQMPRLPPPHLVPGIGKLFDTEEVAQQRRQELHQYVQALLQVDGASESDSLRSFLSLDPSNASLKFTTCP